MQEAATRHTTVLLHEAVQGLRLSPDALVVDATGGAGGHSARILEEISGRGSLIIFESDPSAARKLSERFLPYGQKVRVVCTNFRHIVSALRELSIETVDAVLADLGWHSDQFETGEKGFSFLKEEPLIMTYADPHTAPFTAADVVNTWSEEALADALYAYADERFARRIARQIVAQRVKSPLLTTSDLVACVRAAVPARYQRGRIHPATKTFQALRIAVNDELDALQELIAGSMTVLRTGGRLAIITFHSIEDGIVKRSFREYAHEEQGIVVTKKPLAPSLDEIRRNPRARSAHLRIFQRV